VQLNSFASFTFLVLSCATLAHDGRVHDGFSSTRSPAPAGQSILFIVFARNGHWTEPKALQPVTQGLEARLSPDLKTLYFSTEVLPPNSANSTGEAVTSRIFQIPMIVE
jgi:hypothetical protein